MPSVLIADIYSNAVSFGCVLAELERFGERIPINPGSVGLPIQVDRQTGTVRNPVWAEYASSASSPARWASSYTACPSTREPSSKQPAGAGCCKQSGGPSIGKARDWISPTRWSGSSG